MNKIVKMIMDTSNVCLEWEEGTCMIPLQQTGNDEEVELRHLGMRVSQCVEVNNLPNAVFVSNI